MPIDERKVAIEEACHGIVAYEFGKPVNKLTIDNASAGIGKIVDWSASEIELPFGDDDPAPFGNWKEEKRARRIRRTICIFLGGPYGNFIDSGELPISAKLTDEMISAAKYVNVTYADLEALESDVKRSVALARSISEDVDIRAEITQGEERVRKMLEANWYKVIRIAKFLLERRTIEGPELQRMLRTSRRPWE
jgi:hypothetical protein